MFLQNYASTNTKYLLVLQLLAVKSVKKVYWLLQDICNWHLKSLQCATVANSISASASPVSASFKNHHYRRGVFQFFFRNQTISNSELAVQKTDPTQWTKSTTYTDSCRRQTLLPWITLWLVWKCFVQKPFSC